MPPPTTEPEFRILVVCFGNICRSPMGEVLLAAEVARRGLARRIQVESAGYHAVGLPAHVFAIQVMKRRGLDLTGHKSRLVTPMLLMKTTVLLAMEEPLAQRARMLGADNAFHLAPWATLGRDMEPVADPIGQDLPTFEACAQRLEALIPPALDRFQAEHGIQGTAPPA